MDGNQCPNEMICLNTEGAYRCVDTCSNPRFRTIRIPGNAIDGIKNYCEGDHFHPLIDTVYWLGLRKSQSENLVTFPRQFY